MATTSEASPAAASRWSMAAFGVTILLSAFLLFQVQPLVSKAILPWFGGFPAVWTTCMLFFQTLLFAGYVYAHLLQRWLSPRRQVLVHVAVIAAAAVLLPIAPGANWKPANAAHPTWQILLLLAGKVGLPYFALSATSPLVQAWFSRSSPGRSPYRLYALSNIGSLAALLTYPFLFEPALALRQQSLLWSGAFGLYGALCAVSLATLWRFRDLPNAADELSQQAAPPGWIDRLRWLALPACASLMLLAATNHICQDVAVVPFLWILPLTLYLLSFIICFDHQRWYIRPLWAALTALALLAVATVDGYSQVRSWIQDHESSEAEEEQEEDADAARSIRQRFEDGVHRVETRVVQWVEHRVPRVATFLEKHSDQPLSLPQEVILNLAALFFVCMTCHGELVRLKPDPRHLTEFYLLIAAGGALGGLFVAIVAPLAFSTYLEWPIGMALSAVLAAGLLILPGRGGLWRWVRYSLLLPPACIGLWYLAHGEFKPERPLDRARNFFGIVTVLENDAKSPQWHKYVLMNGRIVHGQQFAAPEKQRFATSYYGTNSGVGLAIKYFQGSGAVRVGAIGLGIGTLATYARPGDTFRFYEINPEVRRIAEAGDRFTYLKNCRGEYQIVMGDARLSLEAEPARHEFHVLALDAFSGDAIPTHLLTREAFDIYQQHLAPNGVIAVHISNRHLFLGPVVRELAADCNMKTTRIDDVDDASLLVYQNDWILVTQNEDFLAKHPSTSETHSDDELKVRMWTDDYSNLFQILSGEVWKWSWWKPTEETESDESDE